MHACSIPPTSRKAPPIGIVTVGELVPHKQHSLLLESFAACSLPADARLHIVGDGPPLSALRNQADRLGVSEQTRFHGRLSRSDVARLLRSADLYVHTSRVETFGVVIVEALLSGLRVVSTPCGGVLESMPADLPVSVISPARRDIAHAIESSLSSSSDLTRQQIAEMARSRFSSEEVAQRLSEIYRDVLRTAQTD